MRVLANLPNYDYPFMVRLIAISFDVLYDYDKNYGWNYTVWKYDVDLIYQ